MRIPLANTVNTQFIAFLLFLLVALTWGTTWMAMKIAVDSIPPIFATGMRFLSATPLLIFIAIFFKLPLLFPAGKRWFQILVCIMYFACPFTLMIYGEQYISSGLAAIIFSNMPIAVLLVSILVLKEKLLGRQWLGLCIGIVSISLILVQESDGLAVQDIKGVGALVAAVLIHAAMYVISSKLSKDISVITYNALPSFAAGLILLVAGWWFETPQLEAFTSISLYAVVYLGVVAGVFGILSYFSLQRYVPPFHASLVFLVFPLIAVGLEHLLYNRSISNNSLILVLPLLIGILLIKLPIIDGKAEKIRKLFRCNNSL